MLRTRVIPCLQLLDGSLVKTVKFDKPAYIGDPINTVRIFNELEVDELCLLDIRASAKGYPPNFELLQQIANECFMPLSYGGGIDSFATAQKIFSIGFEKIILNTALHTKPQLIHELVAHFGSQAIVASIDVKKNMWGKYMAYTNDGTQKIDADPVSLAQQLQRQGVGEILLTSIDRDGTWHGYDITITEKVATAVTIPVIAYGGAGSVKDIETVIKTGRASAAALGSMVVYQKQGMGVLVNFPDKKMLDVTLM
ncbi:MAG: imidazole glycerol phosphate synthase subunit HisF [Sphingobacteriales bacterium]|nr:MAG: imidazole glycerol phosphate synthase subunit HisF [Sphingobacteriales bacterium]